MLNALTVDVEDYFHVKAFAQQIHPTDWDRYPRRVEQNTERILNILGQEGVKATFFVLGWVAEKCPGLVKRILELGHQIGCHGYAHQAIYEGSYDQFRQDLRRAKNVIENISGRALRSYRAPSYSITSKTLWAFRVLVEEGFLYDSSIFPIVHDLYGIPDAPRFPHVRVLGSGQRITEFPASTLRIFGKNIPIAGGGYFRLTPYVLTAAAIRKVNRQEMQPVMVYLHPWELDPDQPRINSTWRSRFRHYQNLHSTESKLKNLINDFSFSTMEEVLAVQDFNMQGENQFVFPKA